MPVRKRAPGFKRKPRRLAVRRPMRTAYNPRPVFTETCRLTLPGGTDYTLIPNQGGRLAVRMDQLPQLAQYTSLYQKYRILKVLFICLSPVNSLSNDINAEFYNLSQGVVKTGMSRLVFAVNDSPDIPAPVNEDSVLTDNGCKIVVGKPKIVIPCKPAPDTLDANGVRLTQRGKFINFVGGGNPEITHYGVTWWHSQPTNATSPLEGYFVYAKITFQLADPR